MDTAVVINFSKQELATIEKHRPVEIKFETFVSQILAKKFESQSESQEPKDLSKKLMRLGQLNGRYAHKFRNSTATLRQAVYYLLKKAEFSSKAKEFLKLIDEEVSNLNSEIDDMVTVFRPIEVEFRLIDSSKLLHSFVKSINSMCTGVEFNQVRLNGNFIDQADSNGANTPNFYGDSKLLEKMLCSFTMGLLPYQLKSSNSDRSSGSIGASISLNLSTTNEASATRIFLTVERNLQTKVTQKSGSFADMRESFELLNKECNSSDVPKVRGVDDIMLELGKAIVENHKGSVNFYTEVSEKEIRGEVDSDSGLVFDTAFKVEISLPTGMDSNGIVEGRNG